MWGKSEEELPKDNDVLVVCEELWVWLEALVDVVISGTVFGRPVDLTIVTERLEPIGLGAEVPHNTSGLDGLLRL